VNRLAATDLLHGDTGVDLRPVGATLIHRRKSLSEEGPRFRD
jgi:hypothetical protein